MGVWGGGVTLPIFSNLPKHSLKVSHAARELGTAISVALFRQNAPPLNGEYLGAALILLHGKLGLLKGGFCTENDFANG